MYYVALIFLLFSLSGCVPPVYEGTTYGLNEFIIDSEQIASGKEAILQFEEKENGPCTSDDFQIEEDLLIEGDALYITLHCPQRPDRVEALKLINDRSGFIICDGQISLPYLSSIEAAGLTLNELRASIQELYCENLKDGKIFIGFKKRRERPVQIIGTRVPMVVVDGRMRLSEVLAKASLLPHANLYKSYIMRDERRLPIDFYKLVNEGDASQNIVVQGGDQIFIAKPNEVTIMVTGELRFPRVIPVPYGFISLTEALAVAGGIPFTGDKSCINIIRGELKRPKIYTVAWKEILHQPNNSLLLMAGDVVYITETPLVKWNRFINQLQPSVTCVNTSYGTYSIFR